ncbi:MAG: phosphoethanolamine transferase [Succinivibrionaceae bacterium]
MSLQNIKEFFRKLFRSVLEREYSFFTVYLICCIYFATFMNAQLLGHFYSILNQSDNSISLFYLTPPFLLLSVILVVFLPLSFKPIFKVAMTVLFITGTIVCYFSVTYGVIFDYEMMQNILQTNIAEAKSYLTVPLILFITLFGIIPTVLLWSIKITYPKNFIKSSALRLGILTVSLSVIGIFYAAYYKNYASIGRNNPILRKEISPYNYIYYFSKAIKNRYFKEEIPFIQLAQDALIDNKDEKPELFVVVVGETARAFNYPKNGYDRNTTPYTENIKNLIFFNKVKSCGTSTAVSVPCMFSAMTRTEYNEKIAYNSSTLADIIQYAGYNVSWYDNDGGCKGVCERIDNIKELYVNPENKQFCDNDSCYDEVLLPMLNKRLSIATQKKEHTVIFLHIMGSHGPTYYKRVPKNKVLFKPACEQADIENCTLDAIKNSYDNSIAYTDLFLSKVIDSLKKYEDDFGTAMLYISDHGESLGEFGTFLHGTPYIIAPNYQTEVPMMVYMSKNFIEDHKVNMNCLENKARTESYSHDNLYHSLLGILDVNTSYYKQDMDIFRSCREWNPTLKRLVNTTINN